MSSKEAANILAKSNIYVLESPSGYNHHIVYAPLYDAAFLASDAEIYALAEAACGIHTTDEINDLYTDIISSLTPDKRDGYISSTDDIINLSILPNNVCNFACSYCYSAKGRSSQRLGFDAAKAMIEHFIDNPKRSIAPLLTFSIFGGGEPLLSWEEVVKPSIKLINEYSPKPCNRRIITLITNGSIIPEDFISVCKESNIDLVISYDILRDVQDSQRKHYDIVSANISKLIDNGVIPAINSVITDINIDRQTEMVEEIHAKYPEINYLTFEPVIGGADSDNSTSYIKFAKEFIKALKIANSYGIKLSCSALRNVDVTADRYCPGEMALCADGSITICPCVSSPLQTNYDMYHYGSVSNNIVTIDETKFRELISNNLTKNKWCDNCFAKWNCGGGCMNENINNHNRPRTQYCDMVRRVTRYIITQRLDEAYREDNQSIKPLIGDYEQLI